MATLHDGKGRRVPEFLREPLEAAQARIEQFEGEAQRVLQDLMARGRASRKDLEQLVQRLSKQDWKLPELTRRIRTEGAERAADLRDRAETFRVEALEKVVELQSKAIGFLGVATREQVEELSKELERLSRKFEKSAKKKPAKRARGEA